MIHSMNGDFQELGQTTLRRLKLFDVFLSDDDLRTLLQGSSSTLAELTIDWCSGLTAQALTLLGTSVPHLETLELQYMSIPAQDIPIGFLALFTRLKNLHLDRVVANGRALLRVSRTLRTLRLSNADISPTFLTAALVRLCGPDLCGRSQQLQLGMCMPTGWAEEHWHDFQVGLALRVCSSLMW
jgi:hypothetical protein